MMPFCRACSAFSGNVCQMMWSPKNQMSDCRGKHRQRLEKCEKERHITDNDGRRQGVPPEEATEKHMCLGRSYP